MLRNQATRREFLSDPNHRLRFVFLPKFFPKHSSWLNQVEVIFGIVMRKVMRRGNFTSVADLEEKRRLFLKDFNAAMAHPFAWTYTGGPTASCSPPFLPTTPTTTSALKNHAGETRPLMANQFQSAARGRSGASRKAMQRLARHTTVQLTLGRYTHAYFNLFDLKSAVDLLPPLSTTSSHDSEVVILRAIGTDDASQSVLPFVLPLGLPERAANPFSLVHFQTQSADEHSGGAETTNNVVTTSVPIPETREFPEESAVCAAKMNRLAGDSQGEPIVSELFGSVRGSGDRPGLQTQCGV